MKCPRDGTELQAVRVLDVDLDKCSKCEGLWLDRGEVDRLRDSKIAEVEAALEKKYGYPEYVNGETDGYMKCPRCNGRLQCHTYAYVNVVKVDSCEDCFGMWLDHHELDGILHESQRLAEAVANPDPRSMLAAMSELIRRKAAGDGKELRRDS